MEGSHILYNNAGTYSVTKPNHHFPTGSIYMNGAFMVVFTRISHREPQDTDIERREAKRSAKEHK